MSTVVTQPWDGDAARFTVEQWKISCLLDTGTGDPDSKSRYRLPVREPNGNINRAACGNAAARLNQVDAPPDRKAAAARKLLALYRDDLHEDPPESLTGAAGRSHHSPDTETRTTGLAVEIRSAAGSRTIGGLAAVFDSPSQTLGSFKEVVSRGFFNKSAGDRWPNVTANFEHDSRMLLGATASGTLRLTINPKGLDYSVDLPESRSDVYESISRGDVTGSSMAFQCYDDDWAFDDGMPLRTLVTGRLLHVSAVTNPAYLESSVSLRSLARFMDCPYTDVEKYAAQGDLRKLFRRSDRGPLSGIAARAAITRLRYPAPVPTAKQRVVDIESRRWACKPLTPNQRLINVLGQRWASL